MFCYQRSPLGELHRTFQCVHRHISLQLWRNVPNQSCWREVKKKESTQTAVVHDFDLTILNIMKAVVHCMVNTMVIARSLLLWSHKDSLSIRAGYIPGAQNLAAELMSHGGPTQWKLSPMLLQMLTDKFKRAAADLFTSLEIRNVFHENMTQISTGIGAKWNLGWCEQSVYQTLLLFWNTRIHREANAYKHTSTPCCTTELVQRK